VCVRVDCGQVTGMRAILIWVPQQGSMLCFGPHELTEEGPRMNHWFRLAMTAVIVLAVGSLVLAVVAGDWSLIWIPILLLAVDAVLILMVRREAQRRQ
jgi:hypothetical protein